MIIYYQKVTIHLVSHSPPQNSDHWPKNWTNPPVCWNWEMDGKGCIKLILLILFSQCKHFGSASYLLTFQLAQFKSDNFMQLTHIVGASFVSIQSKFHQVQVSTTQIWLLVWWKYISRNFVCLGNTLTSRARTHWWHEKVCLGLVRFPDPLV